MAGIALHNCPECRRKQYWIFRADGYPPAEASALVNELAGDQPAT